MENFKWTDENVKECVDHIGRRFAFNNNYDYPWQGLVKEIEKFKQSKQPKPEWEILSFRGTLGTNKGLFTKKADGLYYHNSWHGTEVTGMEWESLLPEGIKPVTVIHSVKRLIDGEVFTVGDICQNGPIVSFTYSDWSKEMIADFIVGNHAAAFYLSHLKKQPKQEWQILSLSYAKNFVDSSSIYLCCDGLYRYKGVWHTNYNGSTLQSLLETDWHIRSVKRLSDGEVFSIGDKDENLGIIDRLRIETDNWGGCYANAKDSNCGVNLSLLKKVPQPKPLFKTEDGKDIYVNDIFWYIGDAWNICETQLLFKGDGCFKRLKTFSTKEAAEEYSLKHKPCLSYKEVAALFFQNTNRFAKPFEEVLMDFVQSKLK